MALCNTLQRDYRHTKESSFKRGRVINFALMLPFGIWGCYALYYGSWNPLLCKILACAYLVANLAVLALVRRRALLSYAALFMLPLLAFLFFMQPSHDREWQSDVAELPWAERFGDQIVIHNIRNCIYQSPTDFVVSYETRTYNLNQLKSIDVSLTDWGLRKVAHTMVSFGFEGGKYLCFSIEARKEAGEQYSSFLGFFRQYELIYIAGDESDLIKLRTTYRKGEDVRIYRMVKMDKASLLYCFNGYLDQINAIKAHPMWYNAITHNCMTSMLRIARSNPNRSGSSPLHWSIILNGYADEHAYERGVLDTTLPFEELRARSLINARANEFKDAPDFSEKIREGLPGT